MCASVLHEVDDAFAVDADLLDEFVTAALGTGMISVVVWIMKIYQGGRARGRQCKMHAGDRSAASLE